MGLMPWLLLSAWVVEAIIIGLYITYFLPRDVDEMRASAGERGIAR